MKIVLFGDYPSLQRERVINLLGHDYEVMALTDDASNREVASAFIDADVIVSNFFDATLPPAPRCKLLQSPSAGIEKIDISAVPDGAFLAVAVGHEIPMSEYVCCAMLDDAIGMSGMPQAFEDGKWSQKAWIKGPRHAELYGRTVGLLGYGGVGREIAVRAHALGMDVHALSRWSSGIPDTSSGPLSMAWMTADWMNFLKRVDYLVVTVPLTNATVGMVGKAWFEAARSHMMLINVARGGVVDEESLFLALKSRAIRKAVIDVWYNYPTSENEFIYPSRFPFHELDNVIMTPHASGRTDGTFDRRWQSICENIKRVRRGEIPRDIVNDRR